VRRARQAKLRAQRLRAARLAAAKKAQQERAKRQAAERREDAAARTAAAAARNTTAGPPEASGARATPFLLAGLVAAFVLLGVAMTPAWAVPWSRAAHALAYHREHVALLGGAALLTIAFCFLVQRIGT
jgi:hypothetical protein